MKLNYLVLGLGMIIIPMYSCKSQPANKEKQTPTANVTTTHTIEHLNAVSFKQKVFNYEVNKTWKFAGDKPAIIDFYADWCGPCKRIAPTLAQIAEQYKGKVNVYKVNVDNEQELASAFGIQSIPALLFIPMASQPQMSTGILSKEDFDKAIKEVLKVN